MIVRYLGETDLVSLINGKEYEVTGIEDGLYRVIDEEGMDPDDDVPGYLYPPDICAVWGCIAFRWAWICGSCSCYSIGSC